MKKILFIFSGALFLFASCVNETENSGQLSGKEGVKDNGTTLVRVAFDNGSRTYFGEHGGSGYSVYWADTDAIQINGANSTGITIDQSHKSAADFTIGAAIEYPYRAVYPAALANGFVADSVLVTLPAVQNYTEGSYDPAAAVMLGYAESGDVPFKCATAFLKVNISGGMDGDAIASVRVRSNFDMTTQDLDYGRWPMSGEFVANFSADGSSLVRRVKDGSSVTLDCGSGVAQGTDLYIAIPPQTYTKGINLFVIDVNGDWQEFISSKAFTAEAGVVYNTELAFNGGNVWVGPGIYTDTDWNALAAQITLNGSCEEFKDEDGTYNLYEDITATTLMRFGGVQGGNTTFSGVLNGNNHRVTTSKMSVPLFTYIAGTVKNLAIGGNKVSINTVGWGTSMLALDLEEGALVEYVTADYTVTAPCTSTGTASVYYYGLVRNIKEGATMQNCLQRSNFIIPSQDMTTGDSYVLPFAYTNAGTVKDCVNEGNITVADVMPQKMICAPIFKNTGTLENFVNTGNFSVNSAIGVALAGVTVFGGGYIHNCVNGEEGLGSSKGVLNIIASPDANGKSFRLGGIAAYGDGNTKVDDKVVCGRFYGCANHGNLTLYKSTEYRIYRSSVAGIVADIQYGVYSATENNDYCTIDGCSNDGYLLVHEPLSNAESTSSSDNSVPIFLGGILGCSLNKSGTNGGALVLKKTTTQLVGNFLVIRKTCTNTGTLEMASASPSPSNTGVSGARLNYVGGIAGFTYGIGNSSTTSSFNAHYAAIRGVQNGIIKVGSSASGCIAAGGILGGCCYTKVDQGEVQLVDYQATEEQTAGKAPVYRGTLGAVVGWVVKFSNIGTQSPAAGINAVMEDNTGLICSSSTGLDNTEALIGFAGVTGNKTVHKSTTEEKHRIDFYGTSTLNGVDVTADLCYGGGNKQFN